MHLKLENHVGIDWLKYLAKNVKLLLNLPNQLLESVVILDCNIV